MSAPGGSIYLGRVLGQIARDLERLAERLGHPAGRRGAARVEDLPLLIKALGFHEEDIRRDAHKALKRLVGEDLGGTPEAWTEWWKVHGPELASRRRDEAAIERLFASFRTAVLEARWDDAVSLLSPDARARSRREAQQVWHDSRKKELRRAFRDAAITGIELRGDNAILTVDWGRWGYAFNTFGVSRGGEGWVFAAAPWDDRVLEQPKKAVKQQARARRIRLRPERFSVLNMLAIGVATAAVTMHLLAMLQARRIVSPYSWRWVFQALLWGSFLAPLVIALAVKGVLRIRDRGRREPGAEDSMPPE